ncbi:MAG: HDIG domain-containing protein [Candidatus Omnitrophica bacterium]|nr:HDIG domain-containing protein [Candidatus Omnitrophota bacterium]
MDRSKALEMLKENLKNKNLFKHSLAVEACLKALAIRLGEQPDTWALAGLLHDLDYEMTKEKPDRHGLLAKEILQGLVPEEVVEAIAAHAGHKEKGNLLEEAIWAVDPLTGLIVACALIRPEKKLSLIDTGFVLNRFGEKRFAAGADREAIKGCEKLGLSLEEFVSLCLAAMKEIAADLEL